MATQSSVLAWRIPWTEEPGGATVYRVAKSQTRLSDFTFFLSIVPFGEGNGNPIQCSCLENPIDRGAWWGYSLWGCKESDTTKQLTHTHEALQDLLELTCKKDVLFIIGAAAAKSLQLCPTLCDPIDGSPPGPSAHGILQVRTLEWVAVSFSKRNYRKKESEVTQLCPTLCNPMDCM